MLTVLSSISYDASLLPHFVRYYRLLGADAFIISIDELVPGIWEKTAEIAFGLPADIRLVPASERQKQTGVEANNKEEIRREHVSAGDWIIPADMDEFIEFPCAVADLMAEMTKAGAAFVSGRFIDRIASDGQLAPLQPAPSIWEQYPLEGQVTEKLAKAWCHKVALCRGDCELASGHHSVLGSAHELTSRQCIIHHFKWREGIVEALRRRVLIYRRARFRAYGESERILRYLAQYRRLRLNDFGAKPGWKPYEH